MQTHTHATNTHLNTHTHIIAHYTPMIQVSPSIHRLMFCWCYYLTLCIFYLNSFITSGLRPLGLGYFHVIHCSFSYYSRSDPDISFTSFVHCVKFYIKVRFQVVIRSFFLSSVHIYYCSYLVFNNVVYLFN